METVTVRMARGDRSTSWGFGVTEAPNRDVIIVNVVGGSLADRAGLRDGDIIDQLEGLGNLDINAVDRLLVTSRDKIELIVHRYYSFLPITALLRTTQDVLMCLKNLSY
ncbi:unnamed protein product [Haemonchus placei]|uniref:PDZ domain-containing protein n=1 Tax=Haemonchus placei TaxID=6290 RepID=A0A0N4WMA6_HAEPC|nr:unnamed protein product [Haemonchus placei]